MVIKKAAILILTLVARRNEKICKMHNTIFPTSFQYNFTYIIDLQNYKSSVVKKILRLRNF